MKKIAIVAMLAGSCPFGGSVVFGQQVVQAAPGRAAQPNQPAVTGTGGLRLVWVLKTERSNTASPADPVATSAAESFRRQVLPEGSAEMELVTDGQSVRSELHGPMSGVPKGSVVLFPAGQADGYVLNPAEKTYFVLPAPRVPALPPGAALPKPAISIKPSGTFETIAGLRAEKVNMSWSMPMPLPPGAEVSPGMPKEITMAYENWCATAVRMPAAANRLMGGAERSMQGFGLEALTKACPFAVRSRLLMSTLPGIELVSEVISARDDSPSPDLFKLPADYKQVPTPKM